MLMKIDLGINIVENKIYSGAGNIFSKTILLEKIISKKNSFLIIVEDESKERIYKNIGLEFGINLQFISNFQDIVDLFKNKIGKYVVNKDFFRKDINTKFLKENVFLLSKGQKINPSDLSKKLNELNIKFSEYQNPNTFYVSGDILNYTNNNGQLLQVSFWDNEIDEILFGNKKLDYYYFSMNIEYNYFLDLEKINFNLLEFYGLEDIFIILDNIDFYNEYDYIFPILREYLIFNFNSIPGQSINLGLQDLIINDINTLKERLNQKVQKKFVITRNIKLLENFIGLNNLINIKLIYTDSTKLKSFSFPNGFVICDDNLSQIFVKKRVKRSLSQDMDLLLKIKKGDYVVHIDHGVGVYNKLIEKEISGIKKEYLMIEYKDNDKLFVPITEVSRLSRYIGQENPKLTSLSTKDWEKKLKKAGEETSKIAQELLDIYAKRKMQKGFAFGSYKEEEGNFFRSFEHIYTNDQILVIKDIYADMESNIPMDRLLSGDVGFGKTEVAFAAIFKAITNGKQTALLTPLVVLAYEHFEKAKERFINYPFNIEIITRFEKPGEIKKTLKKLKEGKIDLLIGTHRVLSSDIEFKDLGLLVIDEEHKFGVKDKEKIKNYKGNIDILSMSATPIPRSLNMALNGLKEVSMIKTAPIGKKAIETIVSPFDDEIIFNASKKELERGGQIFFIHNRVETILAMQKYLEELLPGKKVVVAHGQLSGQILEKRIMQFKNKEYDILLATTVIENGIDFLNVNTIFINESNNFGISQIHQLRGRVGRGQEKAYCYLLFKKDKIKEDASKRLKTIVDYSHLGAGFELAVKDLEIRGGGEILGIKQSGTSIEIGVSLFLEMLEDKIEVLKNDNNNINTSSKRLKTIIDLNLEAYVSNDFFTSELDKLNFYREIETIKDLEDLDNIITGFKDINNFIDKPMQNLFDLIKLKIYASKYKIISIKRVGINYQIDFENDISIEEVKKFLILDNEVKFAINNLTRLRSNIKNFANEEKFVQYLLLIFEKKLSIRKIKKKV